jgi:hypothetical protein
MWKKDCLVVVVVLVVADMGASATHAGCLSLLDDLEPSCISSACCCASFFWMTIFWMTTVVVSNVA